MKYIDILLFLTVISSGYSNHEEYKKTPLGDSVDKASMKILKESFQNAKDKNVIVSPLGALTLLSMFSAGTEGQSRQEIMQLLGFTEYQQLENSYGNLTERFSSMDPGYLILANKMYVSDKYTVNDQFSDVATRAYKSEVEQVDFTRRKETVDKINRWADEKTKGHIKSPVQDDSISQDAAVALFNVIFFQGHWHVPFDAEQTKEKNFYVNKRASPLYNNPDLAAFTRLSHDRDSVQIAEAMRRMRFLKNNWRKLHHGTMDAYEPNSYVEEWEIVKKPMMKLQWSLLYNENPELGAKMVELPYKEDGFRMVIVLPDKRDGLEEVIEKLVQKGILEDVFALHRVQQDVVLELPKFEIKNNLDLNAILPKVGVSSIFSEGALGVIRERPVTVSTAFQDAFVKVDEEGATAGAYSGLIGYISDYYTPSPPLQFKVDHPFLFAILHEDIVLFTGTYTH